MFQDKFFHHSAYRIAVHCTSKIPFIQQVAQLVTVSCKFLKISWIGFFLKKMGKVQYSIKQKRIDVSFIEIYRSSGSSRSQSLVQMPANPDQALTTPHLASSTIALRNALNQKRDEMTSQVFQCCFHLDAISPNNHNINVHVCMQANQ